MSPSTGRHAELTSLLVSSVVGGLLAVVTARVLHLDWVVDWYWIVGVAWAGVVVVLAVAWVFQRAVVAPRRAADVNEGVMDAAPGVEVGEVSVAEQPEVQAPSVEAVERPTPEPDAEAPRSAQVGPPVIVHPPEMPPSQRLDVAEVIRTAAEAAAARPEAEETVEAPAPGVVMRRRSTDRFVDIILDPAEGIDRTDELPPLRALILQSEHPCLYWYAPEAIGRTSLLWLLTHDEELRGAHPCVYYRSLGGWETVWLLLADLAQFVADNGYRDALRDLVFYGLPFEAVAASVARHLEHMRCLVIFDHLESVLEHGEAGEEVEALLDLLARALERARILILSSRPGAPNIQVAAVQMLGLRGHEVDGQAMERAFPTLANFTDAQTARLRQIAAGSLLAYRLTAVLAQKTLFPEAIAAAPGAESVPILVREIVESLTDDERTLLVRIALCRRPVPSEVVEAVGGSPDAVRRLTEWGLVGRSPEGDAVGMHSSVRRVVLDAVKTDPRPAHLMLASVLESRDRWEAFYHYSKARHTTAGLAHLSARAAELVMKGYGGHLQAVLEELGGQPLPHWSHFLLFHLVGALLERAGRWDGDAY